VPARWDLPFLHHHRPSPPCGGKPGAETSGDGAIRSYPSKGNLPGYFVTSSKKDSSFFPEAQPHLVWVQAIACCSPAAGIFFLASDNPDLFRGS